MKRWARGRWKRSGLLSVLATGLVFGLLFLEAHGYSAQQLWARRYDGPIHSRDLARDVAVDAAGNAYVIGHSQGAGSGYDFATVKYDRSGAQKWVRRYNGAAS